MTSRRSIASVRQGRRKAPRRWGLYALCLIVVLLGQGAYAKSAPFSAPTSLQHLTDNMSQASPGLPLRISIPKIKVRAIVEHVGLTPDGAMGIPKRPRNVAWYNNGPRPGEIGSAAMSGHLNWYKGSAGAFARLKRLKKGDVITVQDDTGSIISFAVRATRVYDADEDATDVFVSDDGKAHLNLITCDGVWDKKTKQYSKRLVVFTDKL